MNVAAVVGGVFLSLFGCGVAGDFLVPELVLPVGDGVEAPLAVTTEASPADACDNESKTQRQNRQPSRLRHGRTIGPNGSELSGSRRFLRACLSRSADTRSFQHVRRNPDLAPRRIADALRC